MGDLSSLSLGFTNSWSNSLQNEKKNDDASTTTHDSIYDYPRKIPRALTLKVMKLFIIKLTNLIKSY